LKSIPMNMYVIFSRNNMLYLNLNLYDCGNGGSNLHFQKFSKQMRVKSEMPLDMCAQQGT
jgi:hypothetical protein